MKQLTLVRKIFCTAALLCAAAWNASAVELVTNGGFETGTSTTAPPWVVVDSSNFSGFGSDPAFAHSGSRYAFLGSTGTIGTLSQTINTDAGVPYTLSFWLANDGGAPQNSFQALFDGVPLFTLTNSPAFGYTMFTAGFTGTGAPAVLQFRNRNDPNFWRLDDVSVMSPPPIPTPTPQPTPHGSPHPTPTPHGTHPTPTPHPHGSPHHGAD